MKEDIIFGVIGIGLLSLLFFTKKQDNKIIIIKEIENDIDKLVYKQRKKLIDNLRDEKKEAFDSLKLLNISDSLALALIIYELGLSNKFIENKIKYQGNKDYYDNLYVFISKLLFTLPKFGPENRSIFGPENRPIFGPDKQKIIIKTSNTSPIFSINDITNQQLNNTIIY